MSRMSKTCPVCESGIRVVDYKDERMLSRYITERGKILPSRLSGMCARHQRQHIAILPFIKGYSR
jgi:small subunit ribosomal protein S18